MAKKAFESRIKLTLLLHTESDWSSPTFELLRITPSGATGAYLRASTVVGTVALGKDGDYLLNSTTLDVSKRASDVYTVIANTAGTPRWRTGTGVPSNGTGANGDYWFSTDTGILWLRAAGAYAVNDTIVAQPVDITSDTLTMLLTSRTSGETVASPVFVAVGALTNGQFRFTLDKSVCQLITPDDLAHRVTWLSSGITRCIANGDVDLIDPVFTGEE